MKLTTYIPKPRFMVGVAISLAVIVFLLQAGSGNATVQKIKAYLGLTA
ncbi:MAG: hypothetical protein JW993_10220 [Sedimentisphaerales bacterium]|nr:hypothetical protein [Sedimentisphaerales bacterium]